MWKFKFLEEKETHIEKTGPKELLWFVALWGLGFVTITIVGTIIKLFLRT